MSFLKVKEIEFQMAETRGFNVSAQREDWVRLLRDKNVINEETFQRNIASVDNWRSLVGSRYEHLEDPNEQLVLHYIDSQLTTSDTIQKLLGKINAFFEDNPGIIFDFIIVTSGSLNAPFEKTIKLLTSAYTGNLIRYISQIDLSYNPLNHYLTPSQRIMSMEEKEEFMTAYKIKNPTTLPLILKSDPIAVFLGARPGDLIESERYIPYAIVTKQLFYRICV